MRGYAANGTLPLRISSILPLLPSEPRNSHPPRPTHFQDIGELGLVCSHAFLPQRHRSTGPVGLESVNSFHQSRCTGRQPACGTAPECSPSGPGGKSSWKHTQKPVCDTFPVGLRTLQNRVWQTRGAGLTRTRSVKPESAAPANRAAETGRIWCLSETRPRRPLNQWTNADSTPTRH